MKSVVNAAVGNPTFDSLRLGRSAQSVVGRLIRFWDSRNISKNGEFMGITILLLDELDSVIHGFIPANRANHYWFSLKTGSIVRLDRLDVARVAHTYKITEHQYVIRFIPSTRVVEVQTDAPVIKLDKFMVRRYEQLQVLANTSLELPDVVGEIRSVQGSDLRNQTATSRVVVRLLIEPYVVLDIHLNFCYSLIGKTYSYKPVISLICLFLKKLLLAMLLIMSFDLCRYRFDFHGYFLLFWIINESLTG
ncbi:uncharacterized protein LOC106379630 isoform X2 [Brassica napus]|uniref:uncharacterized protein LOC106379630 isoform X2 n=1 Tax=Brassica napus TaxID=3708 RepID=UPI0006AA9DA4|nr:uncharacterized protein LOC106379630 isoform X2 [Brassica napus]